MCCAILTAPETTMATTQLMRAVCFDACSLQKQERDTQSRHLRMNRVVVTDGNGNRRLKMGWLVDRD